jgi:hypothetical protein
MGTHSLIESKEHTASDLHPMGSPSLIESQEHSDRDFTMGSRSQSTPQKIQVETELHSNGDSVRLSESPMDSEQIEKLLLSPRTTRAQAALESLSDIELENLMVVGPRYSASTLKKHAWVRPMYESFTKAYDYEPWPLNYLVASAFINFLAISARYAISSIEDVFIPSLKRINIEVTGQEISHEVYDHLKLALKNAKRDVTSLKTSTSKSPAIAVDVQRIISCTPDGRMQKATEASLWLFGLCTGSRAITCSSIKLADITHVYSNSEKRGMYFVQIRLKVTKGCQNSDHEVTLEGYPKQKSIMDPVYWLEKHLMKRRLSLLQHQYWPDSVKDDSLWGMSKDVMREAFQNAAEKAGFPRKLFGFHSLRSGFICSALLKAGTDSNEVKAVLENTAFVAGWLPNQPAQLRYVSTCAKRTIVSSRLVLQDENNNVIDPHLTNSETFHGITLKEPCWNEESNYQTFLHKMRDFIGKRYNDTQQQRYFERKVLTKAYGLYVKSIPQLEQEVQDKLKAKDDNCDIERARFKHARKYIAKVLSNDFGQLNSLIKTIAGYVIDSNKGEMIINFAGPRSYSTPVPDGRERITATGHRKRIRWTPDEDRILIEGRQSGKTYVELSKLLPLRTGTDCKDRERNINKQSFK